jgi:uncharacterized protein
MILIPPSEGKRSGGKGPTISASATTLAILRRYERAHEHHAQILGVKGAALAAAQEANRTVLESLTMPSIERYTGVVYEALGYPSMSKRGQAYCDANVRIVSALFGLLAPRDPIPDYKLAIEKLESWKTWKPILSKAVEGAFVIDLLPKAHARAIHYDEGIRVEFFGSNGKALGHLGKHIKGRFIRWLCEHETMDPHDFSGFTEDGFSWNGEAFGQR